MAYSSEPPPPDQTEEENTSASGSGETPSTDARLRAGPSAKVNFQNTKRSYRALFAFEFEVLHLEDSITKLRGEFEDQIRVLRSQVNAVDDKVIALQEEHRKEADRVAQVRGRVARIDDWMNDLQEQVNTLNKEMAKVQGNADRATRDTKNVEMEINTLSRRINEVSDRVGIASRADPEHHVEELEKRISDQDQVIASLKEELQKVLATLGHIVVSGGLPQSGP